MADLGGQPSPRQDLWVHGLVLRPAYRHHDTSIDAIPSIGRKAQELPLIALTPGEIGRDR